MTIRDQSTRTLAEALGYGDPVVAAEMATGILAASPTLATDLDLGTAWRMAQEALPRGWGLSVAADGPGYVARAHGHNGEVEAWAACEHMDRCTCPTPTAPEALVALTAALRERAR